MISRFPHLLLEGSGLIEEIHPEGTAYDEFIRNYMGIIGNLPLPTSEDIYEEVEYDYEIDNDSGNELPPDWNPEEDVVHPYAMLDDYNAGDV